MDDREYFELAGLIGEHLSDLGLDEIADFNNYVEYEGDNRKSPDGKALIKQMLAAFDRYLTANASETVAESLQAIADNVDEGPPPTRAVVHVTDDRLASVEGRVVREELVGLQHIAETREALRDLGQLLLEDSEPPGSRGETA